MEFQRISIVERDLLFQSKRKEPLFQQQHLIKIQYLKIKNQCYQMNILQVVGSNGKFLMIKIYGILVLDGLLMIRQLIKISEI